MKTQYKFISKLTLSLLAVAGIGALHADSLWKDGITDTRGMFADKRAKRVGDIVTIIVQETAGVSNTLRLKTDKESKNGAVGLATNLINQFLGNLPSKVYRKELKDILPDNAVIPEVPELTETGKSDYTGGGEIRNSQTITTRCAVQVIDVLPNGNLILEGVREISFSKERQFASLRGIVRAYDIQPDNTVLSSNVADARIEIVSEGTLTQAQKKGWLLRLNDRISPF